MHFFHAFIIIEKKPDDKYKNREFVDPKLIYILDQDKNQYHDVRHFSASLSGNIIGYRNTDFEAQSL